MAAPRPRTALAGPVARRAAGPGRRTLPILTTPTPPVDDESLSKSDAELRSHVERVLSDAYELEREIGRGGMGIVYLCRDKRLKRRVAVKLLPPELAFRSEIRSRFLREAETAAQLSHPNIVPIYSVDEKDGLVFFVMGFIDGENLATRIQTRGALDPEEARSVLRSVADALAYAHGRGVVHRDIKPDNILLDAASGRPMVTDFGIARAITEGADNRLTATGIAIGTPAYMSPEQSAGDRDIDGRSDLYSLGVVAYQMLCGDLPFNAQSTPALLVKHLSERPVPIDQRRAGLPPDLANAVMVMLEKAPESRFESAASLVQALDKRNAPPPPPPPAAVAAPARAPLPPIAESPSAAGQLDQSRWSAAPVRQFRRLLAPFIAVNAVILTLEILGIGPQMGEVTGFWAVYIAYKYAKLWSEGYDWRDVAQLPRETLFADYMAEVGDDVRALFDEKKRVQVRERDRQRRLSSPVDAPPPAMAQLAVAGTGPHAATARQAMVDRDEVLRLVASLPSAEKARVPDVVPTAEKLCDTVLALAAQLGRLEAAGGSTEPGRELAVLEREIALLESQANPLDHAASEARVRRLAGLKRQRRTVAESERQALELSGRIESCALALQNLKFDVLRLKTGAQSWQHVTSVAEQAMRLAREVDEAVYVGDAMARLARDGGAGAGARPGRA